jgi:hypothetical protein
MNERETPRPLLTEGGVASVEDGHVLLDGPDGVAITLSPEAALATAESLRAAAEQALAERDRA